MVQKTPQTRERFPRSLALVAAGLFAVCGLVVVIASVIRPVQAATNNTINFQARLQTDTGGIVADGFYNIEFKLYNAASGGSNLWTETYYDSNGVTAGNDNRVRVKNGYLTVSLGSQTAFPGGLNWDQEMWLTMNVGGTTQTATPTYDGEMSPRLKMTGVPYAFRAGELAKYDSGTGFNSILQLSAATVGNQTFTIPDQGAAGNYTLLTANTANSSYIQNTTSPQTANFNITGNGTIGGNLTANSTALFQNSSNSTNAFQVQNAAGANIINVDTTTTNYISNPGLEVNTTGWAAYGSSSITRNTTVANTVSGNGSLQLTTSTTNPNGVRISGFTATPTQAISSNWNLSFYAKLSTGSMGSLIAGHNTGSGDGNCVVTTSVNAFGFARYNCGIFLTSGQSISSVFIGQNDTTSGRILYIDNVQLTPALTVQPFDMGKIQLNGIVNSPVTIQANSNSSNLFQVNSADGSNFFNVDTVNAGTINMNGAVRINTTSSLGGNFDVSGNAVIRSSSNVANAFQMQNANATPIFGIGTVGQSANLITNPNFEVSTTGWSNKASGVIGRTTSAGTTNIGTASGVLIMDGTGEGTSFAVATTVGIQYAFSFYAKASTGTAADIEFGYTNGSGDNNCQATQFVYSTGFTRYSCQFTISSSNGTAVYIRQNTGSAQTLYIDGVQLLSGTNNNTPFYLGTAQIRGLIDNPVVFQNAVNSTTAFQIQNAAGTSGTFVVDTLNNQVNVGRDGVNDARLRINGNVQVTDWLNAGGIYSTGYERGDGNGTRIDLLANSYAQYTSKDNTDQTLLVLKGSTTQTADLIQIKDSSNNTLAAMTAKGGLNTSSDVNVGSATNRTGAGRLYSDGFESGNFKQWTAGATASGSSTIAPDTTTVRNGKYSIKATNNNGSSYATTTVNGGTTASVRGNVYVSSHTTGALDMLSLTGGNAHTLFRNVSNGKLAFWNSVTATSTDTSAMLTTGAWHQIELVLTLNATTGSATVYLDGVAVLTQTNINTGTGNITGLVMGETNASRDHVVYYDDIVVDTVRPGESANLNVNDSLHVAGTSSFGGAMLLQAATNSTGAFQIQNAAGTSNLIIVDTVNDRVGIGTASPGYPLDVVGNINSSTGYRVGGTPGAAVSCSGGQLLQDATTVGGIITAGSCVAGGTGITTIGTFSNTSIANGGSITGNTLTFGAADATNPGMVSTGTQTIGGSKTFNGVTTLADRAVLSGTITTSSSQRLNITGTLNSSATSSQYGIQNALNFTPTGGSLTNIYGISSEATVAGSALNLTKAVGISAGINTSAGYTGQITTGIGLEISAPTIGGTQLMTDYRGIFVNGMSANGGNTSGTVNNHQLRFNGLTAAAGSGGTVNNYGMYVTQPSGSGAGTTNNYGIYITGAGGGSTNYAIYNTGTAPIYTQGNLQVGTTSNPNGYALQLAGDFNSTTGVIRTANTERLSNAGALSNITGYSQGSGNFVQIGSGTFATGTGAVSLNGDTSVAIGKKLLLPGNINNANSGNAKIFNGTGPDSTALGTLSGGLQTAIADYGDAGPAEGIIFQHGGSTDAGGMKLTDDGLIVWGAGDNDLFRLINEDAAATVLSVADSSVRSLLTHNGDALFKTTSDTTTAFQIQNSSGGSLFAADTTNTQLNVGGSINVGSAADRGGAGRYFSDGLENGNHYMWSWGKNTTGSSTTDISSSTVRSGKYASRIVSNNGYSQVNTQITPASSTVASRAYVNFSSHTSGDADIIFTYSDNTYVTVYRNPANGKLAVFRDVSGTTAWTDTSATIATGGWHSVELVSTFNASTGSITVYYDGVQVHSWTNINTGTEWPYGVGIGANTTNSVYTAYIDDVSVDSVRPGDAANLTVNDSLHVAGNTSFAGTVVIQPTSETDYALWVGNEAGDTALTINGVSGRVAVGGTADDWSMSINGSLGGEQVRDVRNVSSNGTYAVTGEGMTYYLESNSGTTNSNITSTFNITGLPNVDGTVAHIQLYVSKGATTNSRFHNVTIQIHGNTLGSIETLTQQAFDESYRAFSVARFDGVWMVTGSNPEFQIGFDLAEWIPYTGTKPEAGDVLVSGDDRDGASAKKSAGAYDNRIVGVVTTKPGQVLGKDDGHSVKMALSGRVPVKVSLENGPIESGDYLTSSSIPGFAMKATVAGKVVGTAYTAYDGTQDEATVIAQVQPGYAVPDGGSAVSLQGGGLQGTGVADGQASDDTDDTDADTAVQLLQVQAVGLQADVDALQDITGSFGAMINTGALQAGGLTVTGNALIQGDFAVLGMATLRDVMIEGHISTKGETPSVELLPAAGLHSLVGAGATVEIDGTDVTGTVTVIAGDDPEGDLLLRITFHRPFDKRPRVVLTPEGKGSASLQAYIETPTVTGFIVGVSNLPQTGERYGFTYQILE